MAIFDNDQAFAMNGGNPLLHNVQAVLGNVNIPRYLLQDYRPLTEGLGWQLADAYWATAGVNAFVENEVPFIVTSNGCLSEDAAATLYASCIGAPPDGPLLVLELGAGSGLFARYFLDAFREMSARGNVDFYDRLVYLVSDRSPRTVEQWMEKRMFAEHGNHLIPGTCDAMKPAAFRSLDGWPIPAGPIRAIICNYSLDVLPASVVRQGEEGCEELAIRTTLLNDAALLRQYTRKTPEEIRALVESNDPAAHAELLPLVSLLQLETDFLPVDGAAPPYAEESLSFAPGITRSIVNHGAIDALEACLRLLGPDGFVLVNDYGNVRPEDITENAAVQRFGRSAALGLNFAFLDHLFTSRGYAVFRPDGDAERPIHARLFSRRELPSTAEAFLARFTNEAYQRREKPVLQARDHRVAGRSFEAIESYRRGLAFRGRDWHLLGEVAEYVGLHLRDFPSAVEVARASVMINPWYSTYLWNVLGDCLFCMGDHQGAHEAHMQAYRIDPRDARTNLSLGFTLFELGSHVAALNAIAVGLAWDRHGKHRDALLQKQQQILSAISGRWQGEQERMARGIVVPA